MSEQQESYIEAGLRSLRTIHYWRGFQKIKTVKGQTYLRGHMAVRGTVDYVWFDTIERMDGTPWLRPGTYPAAMEESVDARNPGRRQIRPVHNQRHEKEKRLFNFLIHSSAPPHFLTGCIAPGYQSARGIEDSEEALERIFRHLGGFAPGKSVFIRIDGIRPAN